MTTLVTDGAPANPVFDDTDPFAYDDESNPGGSVVVGGTGTTIEVKKVSKRGVVTVLVNWRPDLPRELSGSGARRPGPEPDSSGGAGVVRTWCR